MKKNIYFYTNILAWGLVLFLIGNYVFGWTTPTANPPSSNLPGPVNVSSTEQTKTGNLTIDGLIKIGRYDSAPSGSSGNLYFDTTADEFKGYKSAGWDSLGGGAGLWTQIDSNIYYNNGDVGIGTSTPGALLHVAGTGKFSGVLDMTTQKITSLAPPTENTDAATKAYVDAAGGYSVCAVQYYACSSGWEQLATYVGVGGSNIPQPEIWCGGGGCVGLLSDGTNPGQVKIYTGGYSVNTNFGDLHTAYWCCK